MASHIAVIIRLQDMRPLPGPRQSISQEAQSFVGQISVLLGATHHNQIAIQLCLWPQVAQSSLPASRNTTPSPLVSTLRP